MILMGVPREKFFVFVKLSIQEHLKACLTCSQNNVSHVDFEILRRCRNETQCRLHEAFAIKRFRPVLNKQLYAEGASKILHVWK